MSAILITGIHGFVGSNLTKVLKTHQDIYGLDIVSSMKDDVVKTYNWNELDQIPPIDCIIHLAGKAHDTKNTSSDKEYFEINLGLTQKIFDYFLQSSATKFIFFSSVKAVADRVQGKQLTEEENPKPQTPYGKSKLAAEEYIINKIEKREGTSTSHSVTENAKRFLSMLGMTNAKKVYILRPCMIHGPGNKGNLNLLYSIVKKGIPWPLGAFENKRSFASIDNVTYIINELINKDIPSGIYNIADDEPLSTNEIIELISESRGKKSHIWRPNKRLIKSIAKIGDYLHLPLNSERLKKLTESYMVSNQKIKNALGINQMPIEAKAGLQKTLKSFEK